MAASKIESKEQSDNSSNNQPQTKIDSLDAIPGIGKKIREKIYSYYQDEDLAIEAVKNGLIGVIPGISYKQALKFAQTCFEIEEQIKVDDIIKTPDCLEIYEYVKNIISKNFQTEYAQAKLNLLIPLPSSKLSLIKTRQEYFEKAYQFYSRYSNSLETKDISNLLKKLGQFKPEEDIKRIRNRIILTDSSKAKSFLDEEELNNWFQIEQIEWKDISSPETYFQEYCRSFDVVIFIGENNAELPDLPNLIHISPKDLNLGELFPEQILQKFGTNKNIIQACIKLVILLKSLKENQLINSFLKEFDIKQIKIIKENTEIIDTDGNILAGIDPKLDEYRDIAKHFSSIVNETEQQINDEIKSEVSDRSIHFDGKQILELYRSDLTIENVRNYIPPEVDEIISDAIQNGFTRLGIAFHLEKNELEQLTSLMPDMIEYPVNFKPDGIGLIEKKIQARVKTYSFLALRRIAKDLQESYQYLLQLVQVLLEFDFFYGIGRFATNFRLSIPTIATESVCGLEGTEMVNLELVVAENNHELEAIPIYYQIGSVGNENIPKSNLNLLTGSNSGGKTVCLITMLQAVLLAQMGLPTLGTVTFYPFDELYFFKKSNGQLTAGAFEATLLQFVQLCNSSKLKLVLADELEAITEPNAAAKVMAGIFDLFLEQSNNYGIFVTHLVELISRELDQRQHNLIRIDGIEASGLDDQLNLIIDRSPRLNYIAKSTPELILKRLANTGQEYQQNFFQLILDRFSKH
jgi:hypothetical protein